MPNAEEIAIPIIVMGVLVALIWSFIPCGKANREPLVHAGDQVRITLTEQQGTVLDVNRIDCTDEYSCSVRIDGVPWKVLGKEVFKRETYKVRQFTDRELEKIEPK